ncbi:MAG: dihydrolipoyllysine-residue acetyltransferase [Pseudomonadota bacterium]
MAIKEISVPDIGGATDVEIIEILVKPGDTIQEDSNLITLESEKAAMDVPSPMAGVVKALKVKVGDKVSQGDVILTVDAAGATDDNNKKTQQADTTKDAKPQHSEQSDSGSALKEVLVPDIGGAENVDVIEVAVKVGDKLAADDPILTLESEKAAMDVPAPFAGTVQEVKVKKGDKVSQGHVIIMMSAQETDATTTTAPAKTEVPQQSAPVAPKAAPAPVKTAPVSSQGILYAGPAVRRLAYELGIDLNQIQGSGDKGRITKQDLQNHIKKGLQGGGVGMAMPAAPVIDFSQFGDISVEALSRINKLTGQNMQRNWLSVPHVTQFEDADITDMEAFRQANKAQAEKQGFKLTPLAIILKAVVMALKQYPRFNSSLDSNGEQLILKHYYHIGVAVDTPNGLVVPVLRDVDRKGIFELAAELAKISQKAREGKLTLNDMKGGCFTISSLGGIGGTAFTPIVNAPEVAILGVSKAQTKAVYNGKEFVPRLMLPLSLSYDHRVIDGALGARFTVFLSQCLSDIRKLLL